MIFIKLKDGYVVGRSDKTDHKIEIRKVDRKWILTILDRHTRRRRHTFAAKFQHLCQREACRFFEEGAFAPGAAKYPAYPSSSP